MADTDNTIPEVDAPDIEERGISQVAGPSRQTNPIVIGIGLVVVVTLLWLTWQGESRARTDLVDTQPEEFKPTRKIEAPSIPKAESAPAPPEPIEPKARPKVERRKPTRDPYLDEMRRLALKQAQEAHPCWSLTKTHNSPHKRKHQALGRYSWGPRPLLRRRTPRQPTWQVRMRLSHRPPATPRSLQPALNSSNPDPIRSFRAR